MATFNYMKNTKFSIKERLKQLLDLLCDEINVKAVSGWECDEGKIVYVRKTRKFEIKKW